MQSSKRPQRLRRLLLAVAGATLALPVAELAHRTWLVLRGTPHEGATVRGEWERTLASAPLDLGQPRPTLDEVEAQTELQQRFLHPFAGWEQRGTLLQLAEFAQRGQRSPLDFEVWVLGGSVAEMYAGQGSGAFLRVLHADPRLAGRRVRIHALARGGWKVPQPLYTAQWMMSLGYRPDAIIALDGFNEVAIGLDNGLRGTHPLYPSIPHWGTLAAAETLDLTSIRLIAAAASSREEAARTARRALEGHWDRSSLASRWALDRVRASEARAASYEAEHTARLGDLVARPVLAGPPFEQGEEAILEAAVRGWAECARQLQDLCAARDVVHLHVLQPTLHDPGAKRATPEELDLGRISDTWRRGVELGYPKLRAAGAELARHGVAFVDGSRVFAEVDETLYQDACHFGEAGNRILGQWIGERLLEHMPR